MQILWKLNMNRYDLHDRIHTRLPLLMRTTRKCSIPPHSTSQQHVIRSKLFDSISLQRWPCAIVRMRDICVGWHSQGAYDSTRYLKGPWATCAPLWLKCLSTLQVFGFQLTLPKSTKTCLTRLQLSFRPLTARLVHDPQTDYLHGTMARRWREWCLRTSVLRTCGAR